LLYTQVLRDSNPAERKIGLRAHLAHIEMADLVVVYGDLGVSDGMSLALAWAEANTVPIEFRYLLPYRVTDMRWLEGGMR
jgi:hypothetical protein